MSQGEYEAILTAIETVRTTNAECHDNINKSIEAGLKGIQLNLEANALVTNNNILGLTKRMDISNGNVAKLQEESQKRQSAVDDFRKLEGKIKEYKKKWMYFLLGGIVFVIGVNIMYDLGAIPKLVEWLINKVF
jgi:hypothetical protein